MPQDQTRGTKGRVEDMKISRGHFGRRIRIPSLVLVVQVWGCGPAGYDSTAPVDDVPLVTAGDGGTAEAGAGPTDRVDAGGAADGSDAAGPASPSRTINVVTEGGAVGDGVTDDTAAINEALVLASSQGKGVYFPTGTYLVSAQVRTTDAVGLYGDPAGLSVIKSNGAQNLGDDGTGKAVRDLTIQDLHFLNVGVRMRNSHRIRILRSIFMASHSAFNTKSQLTLLHVQDSVVKHCVFLRQKNCQESSGISTFKTKRCEIRENVWGLDLNQTAWLETQWSGYEAWQDLLGKLSRLRSMFDLDWDQGRFKAAFYPNRVIDEKIYDNIFNGSPFYSRDGAHTGGRTHPDHVVYAKDYTNLEIVGNWMRGWPNDPSGGLKLRNAYGPAIVAANRLINTPLLQYAYEATAVPYVYQNVLVYRNWFEITKNLTFARSGISYWENGAQMGDDRNIEYDSNVYDCAPGCANITLAAGSNANQHHVYRTNRFAGTSRLIPIVGAKTSYTSGSPPEASTDPFKNHPIPSYDIPEYAHGAGADRP